MEIMDQVIQEWLENDTSDINQYCNGLRIDTKDEFTIKEEEIGGDRAIDVWKTLEFTNIELKEIIPCSSITLNADDGIITGDAPTVKVHLNSSIEPHQIEWSDVNKEYTSVIVWTFEVPRACTYTVSLDLGTAILSNKHIFQVTLLDSDSNNLGVVEEGPAYVGDGFTESETIKTLSGELSTPSAGIYRIELCNNRDFCKGSIRNIILDCGGEIVEEVITK